MSKFIEQLNDYSNLKLIPRSITLNYRKKYEDSKDEMKAIYDRNADVLLKSEIESRELNNLRSIKKTKAAFHQDQNEIGDQNSTVFLLLRG